MSLTNWIVYLDDKDKVGATEDDHTGQAEHNMMDLNWTVLGYVSFKDKFDAVNYGEQVLCPNK